ncbi:hypothetical protein FKW77_008049 [Venturia effusa]|uniref:DNA repair protein Rad26 n=1 Tax=Venturia effusa TaxID=50376 RepID=A0A517L5W3_9PEZI|nr:hypothetical protein FKW77_008049 [Venturia effusa]
MADTDDDDEFGLDADILDALPDNALDQLERDAFQATQGRPPLPTVTRPSINPAYRPPKSTSNLAYRPPTSSNNPAFRPPKSTANPPYRPPRPIVRQQNQESFASDRTVQRDHESYNSDRALQPNRPPSDYGLDDEHVIDLDEQSYAVSQSHNQTLNYSRLAGQQPQVQQHEIVEDSFMAGHENLQGNVAELQQRILQLENDRISLEHAVEEARAIAQSKTGEAAILRQKTDKAAREYDQKVATLRQLHAEEQSKQKTELERVKNEREKIITNNKFLEHDLALEAGRARQAQKTTRTGSTSGQRNGDATPKKSRVLSFRDGFDDSDLPMLSPSRPRSKPSTPKVGGKRKRNAIDNSPIAPVAALQLSEPKPLPTPARPATDPHITSELLQKLSIDESKLRFMQNIFSEPVNSDDQNVFEALGGHSFPSAPEKKLSTLLYERMASQPFVYQGTDISGHFCNTLLSLWEQCLSEKYYDSITVLVAAVQLIVDSESLAFSRSLIDRIVPLAIATSDKVAIPIARASINKKKIEDEDDLSGYINVLACLELLRSVAHAAAPSIEAKKRFWQHMKFDFVLLILMKAQPLPQIRLMLQLLQCSALDTTFGAILSADEGGSDRQARRQIDLIDRLTLLLFEKPAPSVDAPSYLYNTETTAMRLDILLVLQAMCMPEEGGRALACHTFAIARIFKVLHQSIQSLPFVVSDARTHPLVIACVNTAMRLVFYLIMTFKELVDVRQKLSVIQGGTSILLISLTRLAFAERIFAEEGISEASMDMAHGLLDEWLSPDEGEALLAMFSTDRSEA